MAVLKQRINSVLAIALVVAAGALSSLAINMTASGDSSIESLTAVARPIINVSEEPVTSEADPRVMEYGIKIDKAGIVAPVIANVDGRDRSIYRTALAKGAAHLLGSSLPGKGSNIFIYGHSSAIFGPGPYAGIFTNLKDIFEGDEIVVYRSGIAHRYRVFDRLIVNPTDVWVANPTPQEQLTLMTCWPVGSAKQRLIIMARPI